MVLCLIELASSHFTQQERHMQVMTETGLGVQRSKCPMSACHTVANALWKYLGNQQKVKFTNKVELSNKLTSW